MLDGFDLGGRSRVSRGISWPTLSRASGAEYRASRRIDATIAERLGGTKPRRNWLRGISKFRRASGRNVKEHESGMEAGGGEERPG